ncbi:MAG TPA: helix-turn-helix domain-containing protein [Solirubrobacteraceae bacterium]
MAAALSPLLGGVAEEITAAIAEAIPEYRQPMLGEFGRGVRDAIDETLRQFLQQLGRPLSGERPGRALYVALGRGEFRAGRGLDSLQAAYRVGARISWRRMSQAAIAAGLDPASVALLAESIFAYIDEISAESVEGYASAQAASAGARSRERQGLVRALVAGELDGAEAQERASAAEWPLPRALAALAGDHRDAERFAAIVGEGAIAARVEGLVCALVADPDAPGRLERIRRALDGRPSVALGPALPWARARESWSRAAACARLAADGVLPASGLLVASEQLATLVLHGDPALVEELAAQCLGPLEGLTAVARARLEATLLAWLRHQGNVAAVAAELHVHPQTVRYRLARLRERFGAELERPDSRFELELVLRARA